MRSASTPLRLYADRQSYAVMKAHVDYAALLSGAKAHCGERHDEPERTSTMDPPQTLRATNR